MRARILRAPRDWRVLEQRVDGTFWRIPGGAHVIASVADQADGRRWAHLSMSHKSRMPTWPELVAIRDILLGPDVEAYQVAPPQSRYVNLHPRTLHLYACLDAPAGVLPQFDGLLPDGTRSI